MKKLVLLSCLALLNGAICDAKFNKRVHKTQSQKTGVETLNRLLANEFVLLMQTLHYHWNLFGPEFNDYHTLFNNQYESLFDDLDIVAERIRAIGGQAIGSLKEVLHYSTLQEESDLPKPKEMVKRLLKQYEHVIEEIRQDISKLENDTNDHGTKKMLEDLIEKYEKTAWMLRSLSGKQRK